MDSSPLDRLSVVLVSVRNPLNIGAAARAMSNFGAAQLRLVNAYEVAFREARSARGGTHVLHRAEQFTSVADAVADCSLVVGTSSRRGRDSEHRSVRLEQGAPLIRKELRRGRVALLFGSEKTGLTNEDMDHCHWLMRIPTREEHGSMNLGQSVALCLYELVRTSKAAPATKITRAKSGDLERLTSLLFDILRTSEYVKERVAASTEQKVRRLVRRLNLSPEDALVVTGMLRQIAWKIGKTDSR